MSDYSSTPSDNDDLHESPVIEKTEDQLWTPVRVKPRREKKMAEYCDACEIVCYLPLLRRAHRYRRRSVSFMVPMFPGYVFCHLDHESRRQLFLSSSFLSRIDIDRQQEERLIEELNDLKVYERLSLEQEVEVKPEIVKGVQVKVVGGPLAGTGGVVSNRDKAFIFLNIEILGCSVSTRIDIADLEVEEV